MRSFISCAAASRGGFCRATCRRGARSSAGSADGVTRACSRRSTTCSSWLIARGSAARRRPRPRCSTPERQDHRERRPERLRRRQEGEGAQAAGGVASSWSPSQPTSRTGMARLGSCGCRDARSRSSPKPSRIRAMPESGPRAPPALPSRSSGSRPTRSALRTPKPLSPPPEPSSTQPPSCSSPAASPASHDSRTDSKAYPLQRRPRMSVSKPTRQHNRGGLPSRRTVRREARREVLGGRVTGRDGFIFAQSLYCFVRTQQAKPDWERQFSNERDAGKLLNALGYNAETLEMLWGGDYLPPGSVSVDAR